VEYNSVQSGESQSTFRRNILSPYSVSKIKPSKNPAWSRLLEEQALKIEAICSFESSFNFHRTTRHYIPEDRAFQMRRKLQGNHKVMDERGKVISGGSVD
jgi:hypothetical protein